MFPTWDSEAISGFLIWFIGTKFKTEPTPSSEAARNGKFAFDSMMNFTRDKFHRTSELKEFRFIFNHYYTHTFAQGSESRDSVKIDTRHKKFRNEEKIMKAWDDLYAKTQTTS